MPLFSRRASEIKRRREYDLQRAPEFLFDRRSPLFEFADLQSAGSDTDVAGFGTVLVAGNQPPYRRTRRDTLLLSRTEAPTLTIASDPYFQIAVVGRDRSEWALTFSAEGNGETESEADERLQHIALRVGGGTVSLIGPGLHDGHYTRGALVVDGPADAAVIVHASYSAVSVRDIAAPVRIAATHARATILDTTGQVDVTAGAVDFAGAAGRVTLSSESEINLKITRGLFEGTLVAWAQRSVRVLVPPGFRTPVNVVVSRDKDFVCRTELAAEMQQRRQGPLFIFTYGVEPGSRFRHGLHLRSEEATVVIDTLGGTR